MDAVAVERHELHDGWLLAPVVVDPRLPDAIPATVPGCAHTDLLAAGLTADPLHDRNELDVAWVADADWVYRTRFQVHRDSPGDLVELVADGLDTLAKVEVNGQVVGLTENMHRTYRFDIGDVVHDGDNELSITFASAAREALDRRATRGDWPSSSFGQPFNQIRKMACSWGWDWGPTLTTAGIWRPIRLEVTPAARLASVRPEVNVDEHGHGTVDVRCAVGRVDQRALRIIATVTAPGDAGTVTVAEALVDDVDAAVHLDVGAIERWWPRSLGAQPRYELTVELRTTDDELVDSWSRSIGFRSVVLDHSADDRGAAFTFVVNDVALFARGVNWIPDDPFPSRVTAARVRERLQQAVDANVDLVRVWGGGVYESEDFYDACDELGLMVWQDFTFACAAYPEEHLHDEVAAEAADNVERLMPHPSLVLWNGNNENIWGWFDWGWQEQLAGRSWGAGFYLDLLPRIVGEIDPGRTYWPGSPWSGSMTVSPNADAHGCVHVWDVWNQIDLDRYRDRTPRFVAEFGWQAPPTWSTMRTSIDDEPLAVDSPGMAHHQKATDGDRKLARGIESRFGATIAGGEPFVHWWWAAQLVQARAITVGIEHFRSLRGWCMGTVWWQLNDCWPVTSWAVVDGGGRRKPAWYALRDAYRDRLLTVQPRGDQLHLVAVNDGVEAWAARGTARRISFDGRVLATQEIDLALDARSVGSVALEHRVAAASDPTRELIVIDAGGERSIWWFSEDQHLALRPPRYHVLIEPLGERRWRVHVSADVLVRDLSALVDRIASGASVDRQLLTILPGERGTFIVDGVDDLHAPLDQWLFSANQLR